MTFVAPAGLHGYTDIVTETYAMDGHNSGQHHYQVPAAGSMQDPSKAVFYGQNLSCDIKPRLTKEQHDLLEAEFQKQNKPNTNTKKGFADALNVSLDKVNNWFQNRRAKSKQDAKKLAGAYGLYPQQQGSGLLNYDSDTSPSFASSDYFSMMQQCGPEDHPPNGMAYGHMPHHVQEQEMHRGLQYRGDAMGANGMGSGMMPHQMPHDYDASLDMNRRTLTQEQFDAFAHNAGMLQSPGPFDHLHCFPGDASLLQQVFPEAQHNEPEQHEALTFTTAVPAVMSNDDSSIPACVSEQSMLPSTMAMQEHAALSASSSDYADSRTSSLSRGHGQDMYYGHVQVPQPQAVSTTSQWQPGQSVPVDPNALQQHFRELGQRQMVQHQQQAQHQLDPQQEQPLAWPADEAYVHNDSQSSSMLAQQMSDFAIQTPQPQDNAAFNAPAPPSSIAARRQRPRPAQLGPASLRSQSYSGAVQPASPGHAQHQGLPPVLPLRRIRSSNIVGGVANGRIMKSVQPPQRSPLNMSFGESMSSPKALRHAASSSTSNLAPPTPLSPNEMQTIEQQQQQQQQPVRPSLQTWQSSTGVVTRQTSITETDLEHNASYLQSASVPSHQHFTSPPQTPMYQQHPHHQQQQHAFISTHPSGNMILENTPPQSAPAAQQTFPKTFLIPQQQQFMQPAVHAQQQAQQQAKQAQQLQSMMQSQPQQMMNVSGSEQQRQMQAAAFPATQQFMMPPASAATDGMQFQFANGVPVVNAQGQLTMAFPQQHIVQAPTPVASAPAQAPQMQLFQHPVPQGFSSQHSSPQTHYSFVTADGISPAIAAQMPKPMQPAELFVHEYSPPQDLKRAATPRKAVDNVPKNYTFANHGPEHFEKSKKGVDSKAGSVASSSPDSSGNSSTMS